MTKCQFWARYDITFHSLTKDVWSQLDDEIPEYYGKEQDSHLTIHPGFQFKDGDQKRFEHYVYEIFPRQIQIEITGFYYHPNKYQPRVICLDVDTNIPFRSKQKELEETIGRNGGKNVLSTKPPHITVYKSCDRGSEYKRIPSNTNQIKKRCQKVSESKLPVSVAETELQVD